MWRLGRVTRKIYSGSSHPRLPSTTWLGMWAPAALARLYKRVVATDTSQEQLSFAPRLPNIDYRHTPPTLSPTDLHQHVAPPSTVDLVCVAQALHWFDLPTFYDGVNSVLAKPGGVLAVWCYTEPRVDPAVDTVFWRLYTESGRFWAAARQMVDDEYRSMLFPYDPVDGEESTGPFEFAAERAMDMGTYLTYIRSWSAYQTAKERGVELLTDEMVSDLEKAWGGDGKAVKVVRFPIFLRIGKVRT
nr:PREDICTED: putative methyltransferase DDB_G0268948 isoform X2 [Musa acuminata subsp. malaccensis]